MKITNFLKSILLIMATMLLLTTTVNAKSKSKEIDDDFKIPQKYQKSYKAYINGKVVKASWYGKPFHGRKTASGERFNMYAFTGASNSLPMGTKVKVSCLQTKKSIIVKINDTGGFHKYGRGIDLSYASAKALGMIEKGVMNVKVEIVS